MTHYPANFKTRTSLIRRLLVWLLAGVLSAAGVSAAQEPAQTNPNTDWFLQAGSGVFVHYLNGLQNNRESLNSLGRETSWDECVRQFDTERFADAMREAGAGYVIFTVMQVTRHLIAPSATFDRISGYRPGEACAPRNLIEVKLSADGQNGRTVAAATDQRGAPFEATFEPVTARDIRIGSVKPDGPGQEGSQMSVAEPEVYE